MSEQDPILLTHRDRVLRAWQNSTELVRDYQFYADETEQDQTLSALFRECAEQEAVHAARFRDVLKNMDA